MAIRCSSSPLPIIQQNGLIKKPIRKLVILQHIQSAVKKTPTLLIRSSSLRNKVFEDLSAGIVCYRDDKGEIICEGYDEGPRINQGFPRTECHLSEFRDAEIIELLQQNWLQIVKSGAKGVAVQEDLNWKGF